MTNFEKLIRENRPAFDSAEPGSDHFIKFQARLEAASVRRSVVVDRPALLKMAALILVLIPVSVFVFDLVTREIRERFAYDHATAILPIEMREAVQYYDALSQWQMGKILTLAKNSEQASELSKGVLKEMALLDQNTGDLKKELLMDPGNEKIETAILQNQQMKEGIVTNIIHGMTQTKQK